MIYIAVITLLTIQAGFTSAQMEEEYHLLSLDLHNEARAMHHVGPLFLSEELSQQAIMCAQWYADQGGWANNPVIDHNCPYKGDAGENLYQISWDRTPAYYVRDAMNIWYAEGARHNFNGDWNPNTGHFTQIVWAASRLLGYGLATTNGVTVGVALYSPAGNILTQFQQNVFPS